MLLYPILSYTSNQFSEALFSDLGKGRQQAMDLYKVFMRTGSFLPAPSSFDNAPRLFQDMIARIDTTIDPLIFSQKEEVSSAEKFLIRTQDGYTIESVVLSMKQKNTLCLSSQVGCRMGCSFCETGKMGLIRNLSVREMIEQFFHARFSLSHKIENVVFMGMGEPFDNMNDVLRACDILRDPLGIGIGIKNMTLSTSGHVDGIEQLARSSSPVPHLAISLHAAEDSLRSKLMPINRRWNLARLKEALLLFSKLQKRAIFIAYILIEGVNDSPDHARRLISYLEGLPIKINLIPYNAQSGDSPYRAPALHVQDQFMSVLRHSGKRALLRRTKGDGIMAGCGQLGGKEKV